MPRSLLRFITTPIVLQTAALLPGRLNHHPRGFRTSLFWLDLSCQAAPCRQRKATTAAQESQLVAKQPFAGGVRPSALHPAVLRASTAIRRGCCLQPASFQWRILLRQSGCDRASPAISPGCSGFRDSATAPFSSFSRNKAMFRIAPADILPCHRSTADDAADCAHGPCARGLQPA